ncbi:YeeE/YedE family protein [Diaphorobacter sp.]|uniref:YeeE/YedE family protein n=1 Tax=Diaphorobacter sp. TaxID=1934310 RepID=UPI003D0F23BD
MTLLWASFVWGAAFGVAARLGRFCLLRGLRQHMGLDGGEPPSSEPPYSAPALQAFALALAVALLASQGLQLLGVVDLGQALVVRTQFSFAGVLIGGAIFGLGMVLANACGARSLVLLAGGNLRSLVTVVFLGLGAQASSTGVLAPLRQWFQGLAPSVLQHATLPQHLMANQWSALAVYALTAIVPAAILAAYALYRPALRRSPAQWLAALVIGALVAVGWWISASVGADPFDPARLTSLSFIAPIAESLLYIQVAVGRDFGAASAMVAGVVSGACLTALITRTARWEGFDSPGQLARSALGGWLMGFGGLLAAGCSIGQGLTGITTLAWATLPAVAGIVLGAWLALRLGAIRAGSARHLTAG